MSGIVGILNLDGEPVDRSLLGRMTDYMAFRGPDAQAIWVDGAVGLGHTMLRTTWEAEYEQQPFTLDEQVWVVADARIDDRETLAQKLGMKPVFGPPPYKGEVTTDVELILRAYLQWGDDCVEHLLGDFVFAIWDGRRQRLFCARDQFGVKLFYYSRVGNCLIFSNTLNCIRQHPNVSSELNEAAIGDFLLFWMNYDLETTTFADIQRLPPAHTFSFSAEMGVQTRRYWMLPLPELMRYKRSEDYVDHFKELMGQAVTDRLRIDKVASFLSGGMDSTTIAATALRVAERKHQRLDLKAFTVVYDHLIPDEERYYASIAADALGIPIDYQVADDYHPYQGWDSPEFQLPEPAHELFYAKSYERLQRVARHSRVALCGHGGDEALSGATVMNMLQTMPLKDVLFDIGYSLFGYRIQPSWGSGLLAFVRNWRRKEVDQNECPDWINSNFFNRLSLNERWEEIMGEQKHSQHLPRHRAYEKFASPLWASHLEQKDPQFWAVPVEVRHPFLDLRLLNYLLALPPLPWCVDKALLRIAMKQSLPEEVRRRPKAPLAGDPLTVKGFQDVDQEHIWQLLSGIDEYVNADQIRGESRQGGVWRTWQHLCPVSLAYWLNSSLKAARASPALPLD